MKTTVHLKYDKGDVVSINYPWKNIPEDENRFVVDGYFISINEDAEPTVSYIFHEYMNKYIGHNEHIPEKFLLPLEENHPQEIEIDAKDVFGNDINFGEQVYYGIYNLNIEDNVTITNSLSFISGGVVEGFTYGSDDVSYNDLRVRFARNILYTKPYGGEWLDARRFGGIYVERVSSICKTVPETFYKDIVDAAWNSQDYLEDEYTAYEFKELMEIFGQYEQAKEYLENVLEKKEAAKKKHQAKKSGGKSKKSSGKLENITKDIDKLSNEERQKLIKMLTKRN